MRTKVDLPEDLRAERGGRPGEGQPGQPYFAIPLIPGSPVLPVRR